MRIDPKPTIPGYENIEYMRMYRTLSPRDVSGTASLEVRYWDPDKGDDFWIYIPSIRRVRRLPTSARSSTRAPADYCWDDGAGWSGKTPSFNWKYLGERKILRNFPKITPFRHERGEVMAPSEDTDWYLGDAYIIEQTPKDPKSYLIPKRFYQVNKDSFCMAGIWVFDKKGELWKSASTIELISYNANGETGLTGGGFNTYMDHQAYHFTLTDSMHLHGDKALDVRLFSNQNILRVSRGELTLR